MKRTKRTIEKELEELLEKTEKARKINFEIAKGKEYYSTIYFGGGIYPKVKILSVNWDGWAVVLLLQDTNKDEYGRQLKKGDIISYAFSTIDLIGKLN